MKKLLLALVVICSLGFQPAHADSVNVRINPLGLLVGYINVSADFAIGKAWTIGPDVGFLSWDFGDTEVTVTKLGARANWFFNGSVFSDGWYLGPFFQYVTGDASENILGVKTETKLSGTAIGSMIGYGWFWDSFNMMLGLGIAAVSVDVDDDTVDVGNFKGTGAALEWTLGWTF